MCMAAPYRVERIEGKRAWVSDGDNQLEVSRLFLPEAVVGDWVLVHAGQMTVQLTEREAAAVRELLREAAAGSEE